MIPPIKKKCSNYHIAFQVSGRKDALSFYYICFALFTGWELRAEPQILTLEISKVRYSKTSNTRHWAQKWESYWVTTSFVLNSVLPRDGNIGAKHRNNFPLMPFIPKVLTQE